MLQSGRWLAARRFGQTAGDCVAVTAQRHDLIGLEEEISYHHTLQGRVSCCGGGDVRQHL